jgi:hypothetical protein
VSTRVRTALTAALLLVGSKTAAAQTFTVSTALVGTMNVNAAVAGSQPTSVTNSTTTYTLVTRRNRGITRVTANLNAALPAGVTLTVNLVTPGGGIVSAGPVSLTVAQQNVLTGLPNSTTTFAAATITYVLSANVTAGVVASTPRTITFTLQ